MHIQKVFSLGVVQWCGRIKEKEVLEFINEGQEETSFSAIDSSNVQFMRMVERENTCL